MLMYYEVNKQYSKTLLKYDENLKTLHNLKRYKLCVRLQFPNN